MYLEQAVLMSACPDWFVLGWDSEEAQGKQEAKLKNGDHV